MRSARTLAALVASAAILLPTAAAGGTQPVTVFHGADVAEGYPKKVLVWDEECDRNPVRVQFYTVSTSGKRAGPFHETDSNGCNNAGRYRTVGKGRFIHKLRIQERRGSFWSSSGWRYVVSFV